VDARIFDGIFHSASLLRAEEMNHLPPFFRLPIFLLVLLPLRFSATGTLAEEGQNDVRQLAQTSRVLSDEPVWSVGLGNVIGLTVSSDGKWIALSTMRSVTILDTKTFAIVSTLGQARFLSFTPDSGSALITAAHGAVEKVGFKSNRKRKLVRDPEGASIASLSFSPDGKYLAFLEIVASQVRAEQTLAPEAGGGIRIENGGTVEILRGSRVVVLGWPSLKVVAEKQLSEDVTPSLITWSPKSDHLLVTGSGAAYMLLDVGSDRAPLVGKVPYVYNFLTAATGDGHSLISQAAFLDEKRVLAVGQSGLGWHGPWTEMFCFDPFEGRREWPQKSDKAGNSAPAEYLRWPRIASVGAQTIAVFSPYQPGIFLLDPETGSLRGELRQTAVRAVAVSPGGKVVFAAAPDRVFAYRVADRMVAKEWPLAEVAIEDPVLSLARNGQGVLRLADGSIREFNTRTGRVGRVLLGSNKEARSLVSEDGSRFAVESDGRITWYEGIGGHKEGDTKSGLWDTFAMSSDGHRLAYANNDEGVTVIALPEGNVLAESKARGEIIRFLSFSPTGTTIASLRQWDDDVELWSTSNGQSEGKLPSPGPGESKANLIHDGTALIYSPNGRYVAAALWNGRGVALWELSDDSSQTPLSRYLHTPEMGHCLAIRFSWDSDLLACGEEDGSISMFDVKSGALLERRAIHSDSVTTMHFVEDEAGQGLVTSSTDGTLVRYKIVK
jgi:WD40 repeat protein